MLLGCKAGLMIPRFASYTPKMWGAGRPYASAAPLGEPGDWWSASHCLGLQPTWFGRYEQGMPREMISFVEERPMEIHRPGGLRMLKRHFRTLRHMALSSKKTNHWGNPSGTLIYHMMDYKGGYNRRERERESYIYIYIHRPSSVTYWCNSPIWLAHSQMLRVNTSDRKQSNHPHHFSAGWLMHTWGVQLGVKLVIASVSWDVTPRTMVIYPLTCATAPNKRRNIPANR